VRTGGEIGIHYDPMLAKVIAHAPTRVEATQRLRAALDRAVVAGVTTNRRFLARVLAHPEFLAGHLDTHFLDRHDLRSPALSAPELGGALTAAALAGFAARAAAPRPLPLLEAGWRNVRYADEWVRLALGDDVHEVRYRNLGAGRLLVTALGASSEIRLVSSSKDVVFEDAAGHLRRFVVVAAGPRWHVSWRGGEATLLEHPRFPDAAAEAITGACTAPMPGKVVKVLAAEGDTITAGQPLLVLEAMKMEHTVRSAAPGTLARLAVSPGDQVEQGALLAVVS
jgi:acetyl/propionyl-CoA carboxylase alpha subunit